KLADYKFMEVPQAPASESEFGGTMFQAAAANTTVLGWWQFDTATGQPTTDGWTSTDMTAQVATYFPVDGPGCSGVTAVNGTKSMWCGQWASTAVPYCGWAALPGYGNNWDQSLISRVGASSITFTCIWDSEPSYDFTYVEYYDNVGGAWVDLPVNAGAGFFDGNGGPLTETHSFTGPTDVRFHFVSDGAWSNEDGLWPTTEGSFKVDDIQLDGGTPENWENEACYQLLSDDAVWKAEPSVPYGLYAALTSAATIVQEDPCARPLSNLWTFFDDPTVTNYACGGWPLQGAMPYGPDANGLYINNEIWSPAVDNIGTGSQYRLSILTYRDLPLDNLQFYIWSVRTYDVSGCPTPWDNFNFVYYGGQKDWIRSVFEMGSLIPGTADKVQVSIGAVDMCLYWCGVYGTGSCHSHAPLIDQARLVRVSTEGPQWNVRHIDLFHDNFPEDGTVTGAARADMAQDILPAANPAILPGDSIAFEVTDPGGLGTDPQFGGPAVYVFAKVVDRFGNDQGVTGPQMESPDITRYVGDVSATKRFPYCGTAGNASAPAGLPAGWQQFRCDPAFTSAGGSVSDRFCGDLMDVAPLHVLEDPGNSGVFVPGHVVRYFLGAKNAANQWSYFHRTFSSGHALYTMEGQGGSESTTNLAVATAEAMEFSILPDAGLLPGDEGDILFVDDADDRGGPAQLYFDWAFDAMGILDRVDRFDVLGPSSQVGNSLASRVKSYQAQLIGDTDEIYQKILWNSSDLSAGLVCDGSPPNGGSGPDKSLDWTALKFFMDFHPNNPGCYFAGDDLAQEWNTLAHPDAVGFRGTYMSYLLTNGNHAKPPTNLPVSPKVYQNTGQPIGPAIMTAYGGCPAINDFDVMAPGGPACAINSSYNVMDGPYGGVMRQASPNLNGTTARVVLSGFAFNFIRDDVPAVPGDRSVHLHDIITWFQNVIPDPIGVDPIAFENKLGDAYPNPFNPTTTIKYSIKENAHVSLKVYNVAGQLVRTLVDEMQAPTETGFTKEWNGMNDQGQPVSSGVYFYKLVTKNFSQTKKMVLLK
ncbi:MAG: T9SS type A sorting domain-containing protein, partial [bacterium]